MIGKLIAYGNDRDEALDRILEAMRRFRLEGVTSNMTLQAFIIGHDDFRNNRITTRWLEQTGLPAFANREE
jgi:acetyl-CoA carboxylase biotin carboxylase subunit